MPAEANYFFYLLVFLLITIGRNTAYAELAKSMQHQYCIHPRN